MMSVLLIAVHSRGLSAFDDVSVDSHTGTHHEADHSPRVTLRTQDSGTPPSKAFAD